MRRHLDYLPIAFHRFRPNFRILFLNGKITTVLFSFVYGSRLVVLPFGFSLIKSMAERPKYDTLIEHPWIKNQNFTADAIRTRQFIQSILSPDSTEARLSVHNINAILINIATLCFIGHDVVIGADTEPTSGGGESAANSQQRPNRWQHFAIVLLSFVIVFSTFITKTASDFIFL